MEILINELSLTGQFDSIEHFIDMGLIPFIKILSDIDIQSNLLLKKYDFYNANITSRHTIHDIFIGNISRQKDEIRKLKSRLDILISDPYWEKSPKQSTDCKYLYNNENVNGSSLAEACERDRVIISFNHSNFRIIMLLISKDKNNIELNNLYECGHYTQLVYKQELITFEMYCCKIFSNKSLFTNVKLDFSKIDKKEGFSLIRKDDEDLFLNGFRQFSELSWPKINTDVGLDYKEYKNKKYFKNVNEKIFKFRISEKYRCFGYVKNGVFFVLQFDLEHKLSDSG